MTESYSNAKNAPHCQVFILIRYLFTDLNKLYSKIKMMTLDVTIKIKNRTVSLNGIGYVINLGGTCLSMFNDRNAFNLSGI